MAGLPPVAIRQRSNATVRAFPSVRLTVSACAESNRAAQHGDGRICGQNVFVLCMAEFLDPALLLREQPVAENVWPAPSARGDFHLALISLLQRIRSRASNPAKMEIRAA